MAAFNKFDQFALDLAITSHVLTTAGSQLMVIFSNTAPVAATGVDRTSITEIAYTNITSPPPRDVANIGSETPAGTWDVAGTDQVFNATGAVATFQYVVLYNETATAPTADRLIGWWDYGSGVTLANGESFTVDFGASIFTIT